MHWSARALCLSLAGGLTALTLTAAKLTPTVVYDWGHDDTNGSRLNPKTVEDAPFVRSILAGAGFSPDNGWNFFPGDPTLFARDVTIDDYYAWVVNSPDVVSPGGAVFNVGPNHKGFKKKDIGGAVFALGYTPGRQNDPEEVHFIQVYSDSVNGGPTTYHVDNNGLKTTPFYDEVPGASVGPNWFSDEPWTCENPNDATCSAEGIEHYHEEVRFGIFLAVDHEENGVHKVSVYGGYKWGYDYSSIDDRSLPEPALGAISGLILAVFLWGKRRALPAARTVGETPCCGARFQRAASTFVPWHRLQPVMWRKWPISRHRP